MNDWTRIELPPALLRIPTMLSDEEKQYLIWLTESSFEGWGAIVDLGPWLGSSSAALAEGLRRRDSDAIVHSYDLFQWEPSYMSDYAAEPLERGASFLHVFERETADYARWIRPEAMDLTNASWTGGPIEILFVDAAKSWGLTRAILEVFGPHLHPERSRVVFQDFRHYFTYWLPLLTDSAPDLWTQAESTTDGTTTTFLTRRPLTEQDWTFAAGDYSLEQARPLFESRIAAEAEGSLNRSALALGLLRQAIHKGDLELGAELHARVGSDHPEFAAVADEVREVAYQEMLTAAHEHLDRGETAPARALVDRYIAEFQRDAEAVYALAFAARTDGDEAAARSLANECLEEDAKHPHARLLLLEIDAAAAGPDHDRRGEALLLEFDEDTADDALVRGFQLLLQHWTPPENRGDVLTIVESLRERHGSRTPFRVFEAQVIFHLRSEDDARKQLDEVLRDAPTNGWAREVLERWSPQ